MPYHIRIAIQCCLIGLIVGCLTLVLIERFFDWGNARRTSQFGATLFAVYGGVVGAWSGVAVCVVAIQCGLDTRLGWFLHLLVALAAFIAANCALPFTLPRDVIDLLTEPVR